MTWTWFRRIASIFVMHAPGLALALYTGTWWLALIPIQLFGQIPSSLTDDYGALLTTTLRAMQPRLHDNITRGNKFLAWLEMKGRFRSQDGGERVKVALMHAQNSTADIYAGYGVLDTTPQDGITSAFFEWSQLSVSIAISRLEERQNSGRSQAISLLQSKTQQAEASIRELLNNCIVAGRITSGASANQGAFSARVGSMDSGATGPQPLSVLIDSTADRSVSVGNINGATYTFWQNQATDSAATTFAGLKQDMNTMYNDCSRGVGGSPDLILTNQVSWEQYWNSLQNQERYVITEPRVVNVLAGSDAIKFRQAALVWDEVVPDQETNGEVVDAIGLTSGRVALGTMFFINSETFEWVRDAETDFITTPFLRPENQDARVAQILWMGAMGINNRRKNGSLHGISQSIVA